MDLPLYLRVLWKYKVLLVLGAIVAVACGTLAGYSYTGGKLEPRAKPTYRASTTITLGSAELPPFATGTEPQVTEAPSEGEALTPGKVQDLSDLALYYAYLITGNEVQEQVQADFGALQAGESVTALRRSTQPGGDEKFPGRASLPIDDVVAISGSAERAKQLSQTTAETFIAYVRAQQDAQRIPAERRVQVQLLKNATSATATTSSPLLPVILVGTAVFLAFVALAFILFNISLSRRRGTTGGARRQEDLTGATLAGARDRSVETPTGGVRRGGDLASAPSRPGL